MRKKAFLIAALLVLALIGVGIMMYCDMRVTVSRCVVTDSDELFMVYRNSPVRLYGMEENRYETGDLLLIVHSTLFLESYPEQSRAYVTVKLADGTEKDVSSGALGVLREMGFLSGK